MSAVWEPVNPVKLVVGWHALQGFGASVNHLVLVLDVFGKVELCSSNCAEPLFDDLPHDFAHGFGTAQRTVEISAAEVDLLRDGIKLVFRKWLVIRIT